MVKICFTAIFGDYEDLKPPTVHSEGWRFICFTDQPLQSDVWEIVHIGIGGDNPQRRAREIKILPHKWLPSYDWCMWIDASFQINTDLNQWWAKYWRAPFTCPSHPIRNCVYREIQSCIVNKRGDEVELERQAAAYRAQKVPHHNGIITSGVLMRDNSNACRQLCEAWWAELSKYSARDQVAFANVGRFHYYYTFKWDYSQAKDLRYFKHYKHRH